MLRARCRELRIRNLEPRDYKVRVLKEGFKEPPQQQGEVRKGSTSRLMKASMPPSSRSGTCSVSRRSESGSYSTIVGFPWTVASNRPRSESVFVNW